MEEYEYITLAIQLIFDFLGWLLLSISVRLMLKKLQGKHRWMAWFRGLRYYAFGKALGSRVEGLFCAGLELSYSIMNIADVFIENETVETVLQLIRIVTIVTLFVYQIRLFLRVIKIFELKRRWILLWLVMDWLALMIIGGSKKYQPNWSRIAREGGAKGNAADVQNARIVRGKALESGLSIDVKDRSVRDFGRKKYLLKDIEMEIPNSSLVLLLGGSGAGKTTFVNAVIGYEQANATILLNGCNVYKEYDRVKYRIGFVPQQNLMRGNDTVIRTIDDAAEMRLPSKVTGKQRDGKVEEVLDLLGLAAGSDGLVSKKSGGQLRRIAIAMELVTDPELFVLDEPDSGLDGVIAREIFEKLRAIADDGKIVMVITHTPDRVIDLFDKVIVLAKDSEQVGRLAFYGSPKEAKEFFGKDTMEEIVMSVNREEEGGEGLADLYIERYAQLTAEREGGAGNEQ